MRLKTWLLVMACMGLVLPCLAGPKVYTVNASKFKGKPSLEEGKANGLYTWVDADGIHVRWATSDAPTLFHGRVDTDRPIKETKRLLDVGPGWVKQQGDRIVMFSSTTRGDLDGFDLNVPGCRRIQLELTIDGQEPKPEQVFIGKTGFHPPGFPLLLYAR